VKAAPIYARRLGWRVLPIEPGGKRPLLADWPKLATNDPETIAGWLEEHAGANLGVATGVPSGFFALDVDPRNGGDDALDSLTAEHGDLPPTPQAATPSGGTHYLFALPDFPVSNSAGKLGPGLDVRGDGGQIVVAPSTTAVGAYRWVVPPWDVAPAAAPTWLLERLRTRASVPAASQTRGHFPPASPEVLQAARDALASHGPAIEGNGGDLHTFRAAALLVHDFALTDDEAWPLLVEWNEECEPAWDEDDLRAKLYGGGKYGKAPYGCKRAMDALQAVRKMIVDWRGSGIEAHVLTAKARPLFCVMTDPVMFATAEQELADATGLTAKRLGLPRPPSGHGPLQLRQGEIRVAPDLHRVADESLKAIKSLVFQRAGVLCEVAATGQRTFIHDLEAARIQDLMSKAARYVRDDEQKGAVVQAAPERVATILSARRVHPEVRVLEAITTAPIFLADGTILQDQGYNEQARVWLEPSVSVNVPDNATLEDAREAVALFEDLLCDFQFASEADFSSWLAGLLTPLVKAATGNAPSPLFCVSASSPGAGKTLLTTAIARIVTGLDAEIRTYNPRDAAEWGKRLTSFVKSGAPVNVFDNVNGAIGDESLDRLITASTWSDRLLGASEAPPLPNVGTWLATGNNIEPVGDTVRRVLLIRIEVQTERPQERTGFRHDLEGEAIAARRSELLGAALTLLRAYHCAGRPAQPLPSWGSFSAWSKLVRGALVWAGCADPFVTQSRASAELNEPEHEAHDFWISIVEETDGQPVSIATVAVQRDASSVLSLRETVTAWNVRKLIARFIDKPRAGKRIRKTRDAAGRPVYSVETI
jgi:hypothetical protein